MRGESGSQGRGTQAPDIAGLSRSFQTVHHEDLASSYTVGALRAHQHLHIGLGAKEAALDRKFRRSIGPPPEMADEGLEVWAAQERFERSHCVINL
jgi:hypothetical protein